MNYVNIAFSILNTLRLGGNTSEDVVPHLTNISFSPGRNAQWRAHLFVIQERTDMISWVPLERSA